ncbi:MAG: hypothetical protein IPH82_29625 [Chloroflexi bacterium]|nr:hypothetical protein [Chloroflexota bacterium]
MIPKESYFAVPASNLFGTYAKYVRLLGKGHVTTTPPHPNQEGIYWLVRTANGTEYRLGHTTDAEEWQRAVQNGSLEISGHLGRNASETEQQTSAIGWYVDQVTDTFGNKIVYTYNYQSATKYACDPGDTCSWAMEYEHRSVRISTIAYNIYLSLLPARQAPISITTALTVRPFPARSPTATIPPYKAANSMATRPSLAIMAIQTPT